MKIITELPVVQIDAMPRSEVYKPSTKEVFWTVVIGVGVGIALVWTVSAVLG